MAAETLCSSPALPTSSGDQRRCCFCDRDVMYGGSCQAPPTTTGALLQATAGTRWPSLWPSSCRASWSGCRSSRRSSTRRAWCRCVSGAGHRQGAAASSLLRRALLLCAWASSVLAGWLAGWLDAPACVPGARAVVRAGVSPHGQPHAHDGRVQGAGDAETNNGGQWWVAAPRGASRAQPACCRALRCFQRAV